ncbi:MAG: TonB-dependent receptor [Bacteroidales bacterium]|nr:TonB-dependent receptor [Bacteroidales bacterium]MCF8454367.1 TonB-dependent receptor [Bacteroidales bacterium]
MKQFFTLTFCITILFITSASFAQKGMISGVVVDNEGISLPGVTVVVKGTTNGTSTSVDGKYVLDKVKPTDTIQFSFVGYETQLRHVNGNEVINLILKESSEMLDDIQVVAFQKQRKESVIASINTINPGELRQPSSNITAALAGKMSGIIAYQRSGEPGNDNAEFFIRGVTSFGYKNSPLILIDGLEVSSEDLARIEPDNIASFSIMKDATATSLYGSKGANGVIYVTTKEGKKGKARISIRYENSISTPTMTNTFLDGVDYMELYNEALRTRYPTVSLRYDKMKIEGTRNNLHPELYPNVDWYDELFKTSTINKKANLNINGGGDVAQYYLSASYTNENGLLKVDPLNNFNNNIDINRYNLRANVNIKLTRTTRIKVKFSSLFDKYNGPKTEANDIFNQVMQANPVNYPQYYEKTGDYQYLNHTLFGYEGSINSTPNPYAEMVRGFKDRFSSTILSLVQLEQDLEFITKGLNLRAMASIRSYSQNSNERSFLPFFYGINNSSINGTNFSLTQLQEGTEYINEFSTGSYANSKAYFEMVTQYDRAFAKKHRVGALLATYRSEALNTTGGATYLSTLPSRNLGLSGRATYAFDSRYFTELNFGYNGSERFAEDHRFGFFPSMGFGWIVSNQKFFEKLKPTINLFKLKYTYGLVGKDDIWTADDRFLYLSNVNLQNAGMGYNFGNNFDVNYPGYSVVRYSNPDITWEIARKTNYGIELGLWDMMTFMIDYFNEHRTQIYMKREYLPETVGSSAEIWSNIGEMKSHGIDASLDMNYAFSGKFWMSARANFTYATNEVTENGEPDYPYPYMSRIGQPANQLRGLVAERLFVDVNDAINSPNQFGYAVGADFSEDAGSYGPGDIKYVDINEDGKIDDNDMVPIGFPTVPEMVFGFGISTVYKNIDFSFFMQGSANQSFFIDPTSIAPFINDRNALDIIADNHWSEDNPDPYAFWPRLSTTTSANNEKPSTWWLRNGSFVRLKSIEFGYSFPTERWDKKYFSKLRVYFSGLNLLTFSKFKMWDPEMAGYGLGYPTQKVYNIGIQANF